jgi:catalase
LTIMYTNRGTPIDYRHMHGYSGNTFKWVNDKGEVFFAKYTFKTDQGIKNFNLNDAKTTAGFNAYHASEDMHEAISRKEYPSWTMYVQLIPEAEGEKYRWDIYDCTKVWCHNDYPLIEVGRVTLNQNPTNYFAEVE